MNIDKYGIMIDLGDTLYISGSWAFIVSALAVYSAYKFIKKYYT